MSRLSKSDFKIKSSDQDQSTGKIFSNNPEHPVHRLLMLKTPPHLPFTFTNRRRRNQLHLTRRWSCDLFEFQLIARIRNYLVYSNSSSSNRYHDKAPWHWERLGSYIREYERVLSNDYRQHPYPDHSHFIATGRFCWRRVSANFNPFLKKQNLVVIVTCLQNKQGGCFQILSRLISPFGGFDMRYKTPLPARWNRTQLSVDIIQIR